MDPQASVLEAVLFISISGIKWGIVLYSADQRLVRIIR
jgi:hypothetical protein